MREAYIERAHPTCPGGILKIYKFPNGYGASVIRTACSSGGDRGLWELAVVQYSKEDPERFHLTYDTPLTSNVLGHLNEGAVDGLLSAIEALEAPNAIL